MNTFAESKATGKRANLTESQANKLNWKSRIDKRQFSNDDKWIYQWAVTTSWTRQTISLRWVAGQSSAQTVLLAGRGVFVNHLSVHATLCNVDKKFVLITNNKQKGKNVYLQNWYVFIFFFLLISSHASCSSKKRALQYSPLMYFFSFLFSSCICSGTA